MKQFLWLGALFALSQAQASTGVSCLLRVQVLGITEQPFMQEIARLRLLDVQNDRLKRNDFPCTQQFKKGMALLVDVSRQDMKLAYKYAPGQVLHLNFTYSDDRSGFMTRAYTVISAEEFLRRQQTSGVTPRQVSVFHWHP